MPKAAEDLAQELDVAVIAEVMLRLEDSTMGDGWGWDDFLKANRKERQAMCVQIANRYHDLRLDAADTLAWFDKYA